MIIQSAQEAIEGKDEWAGSSPSWDYLSVMIKNKNYRIVFEESYYGRFIRQWSIDENIETDVKYKMEGLEGNVLFDSSEGRLGIRNFEKDSMAWEFLLKPIGLPFIKNQYLGSSKLLELLDKNNIEYKVNYNTIY